MADLLDRALPPEPRHAVPRVPAWDRWGRKYTGIFLFAVATAAICTSLAKVIDQIYSDAQICFEEET